MEKSRLGIPAIFGADVIHGYRTIFPIPLASACSWNPELLRKSCRIAAAEAKTSGVDWTFAPMIDLAFDARWGRIAEGFGESPYAASVFCVAAVKGFQGDDLSAPRLDRRLLETFRRLRRLGGRPRLQLYRHFAAAALGDVSASV